MSRAAEMTAAGTAALDRLAARMGVVASYRDFDGIERAASPDTKRALLAAMGVAAPDERRAAEILAAIEAEDAARLIPREAVLPAGAPGAVPLSAPTDWRLTLEGASAPAFEGRADERIALPALPPGVHDLAISAGGGQRAALYVHPRAPGLADITGRDFCWGVTASVYGLRSERNAGLGDYADLGATAAGAASHGAAFFGVNPVHAPGGEGGFSPYSPGHRGFLNPAHIALDAVPEFVDHPSAQRAFAMQSDRLDALRAAEFVDHEAAAAIRESLLPIMLDTFEIAAPASRRAAFEAFVAERGAPLRRFALAEAIAERHGPDWRAWPAGLRDAERPETAAFAAQAHRDLRRHAWLQWLADGQLGAAQAEARAGGAALGLYLDLAVGPRPGGAEVWAGRGAHAHGVSLGAPPDAFSPQGQTWALAPFSPEALRARRGGPFVEVLRATLRHAGLVRIDHALGLHRAFWVPEDGTPGGYVAYPTEPLLALVAIEAQRAGCVVVGEDLGLVPAGLRERLDAAGLYGCAVMQFERGAEGGFRDPRDYRRRSLASFGTHDTPTWRGYRAGRDIDWAERLGRMTADAAQAERAARRDAAARLDALCGRGPDDQAEPEPDAMHRALARAGSELVAVQLDDALGSVEQQNLPGTIDEHPNWRRRFALPVENFARSPALAAVGAIMDDAGRGRAGPHEGKEKE